MKNENDGGGNQMKYSIWNTRTEENIEITKEKITEALERSSLQSTSTEQQNIKQP
ncbi:hypothetical protein L1999_03690 [Neobacillus drentensis]|uniref:hypothetical protein n=1 Tax=Neobacillus drentensis TaxID=220684 RepID=UPI001F1E242F|nr:hypothetical protein [Neobacillus drentensis]ULT57675.1 hypothetical protein L1999_03690 [Neobacillus drentensis]